MSSFSIERQHKAPIEWKEAAWKSVGKDSYMMDTAISLLAGLGVGALASPIAGGAIAILMIKLIFDKENQKIQAQDCIREYGLVAPFLDGDDFLNFAHQVGQDSVVAELNFAEERGLNLSPTAWDYLDTHSKLKALPQAEREGWAPMPAEPDASVRITTQLGEPSAIDTSAQVVTESDDLVSTLINNPYQCRAIMAWQRTGKTRATASATASLARTDTWIGYLNLFDHDQGNREMFAHAECLIDNLDKLGDTKPGHDLIDSAIKLIETFFKHDDAILVIDEWASLGAKTRKEEGINELWREIANKSAALSSQGVGSGKAIWGIAPIIRAEVWREEAKVSFKSFEPLVMSIAPGQVVNWTNQKTGKVAQITYRSPVVTQASANFGNSISEPTSDQARAWKRAECVRVYYWNGEWSPVGDVPLPKSENLPVVTAKPQTTAENTIFPISEIAAMRGIERPEIEADTIAIARPETLEAYPRLKAICVYLEGKEPRNLKQIADNMKARNLITDEDLQQMLGGSYTNYKDGIQRVIDFGMTQGFIEQIFEGTYTVNY